MRLVVATDDRTDEPGTTGRRWTTRRCWPAAKSTFDWPELDERQASGLCYTSGTTGSPKGVLYSHRSTMLHTMACLFADGIAMRERDVCMPVVPMFHANAWGFPYAA